MDHLRVLKRALHIAWTYRALWLVGLLLVLAGGGVARGFLPGPPGGGGGGGGSGRGWEEVEPYDWPRGRPNLEDLWQRALPVIAVVALVVGLVVLFLVALGIAAVVARYVARVSLIQMVHIHEETGEKYGFRGGLRLGWSKSAFRLFLANLLLRLPLALLMLLLVAPVVTVAILSFTEGSGPAIGLGIGILLLLIPIILLGVVLRVAIGPILEIAYRVCALQGLGAGDAVRESFRMVRRHLGTVALQWLLLVGLGIGWNIVLMPVNLVLALLALFVSGLPALLLGGAAALVFSWPVGLGAGLLFFIPAFIVLVAAPNVLLSAFATVFHSAVWTLTYRELAALDEVARSVPEDGEPSEGEPASEARSVEGAEESAK